MNMSPTKLSCPQEELQVYTVINSDLPADSIGGHYQTQEKLNLFSRKMSSKTHTLAKLLAALHIPSD